jgi:hypothetical protein
MLFFRALSSAVLMMLIFGYFLYNTALSICLPEYLLLSSFQMHTFTKPIKIISLVYSCDLYRFCIQLLDLCTNLQVRVVMVVSFTWAMMSWYTSVHSCCLSLPHFQQTYCILCFLYNSSIFTEPNM